MSTSFSLHFKPVFALGWSGSRVVGLTPVESKNKEKNILETGCVGKSDFYFFLVFPHV